MNYLCNRGHEISTPYPLERCPLVVRGCPCPGQLEERGPNWGRLRLSKADTAALYAAMAAEARAEA